MKRFLLTLTMLALVASALASTGRDVTYKSGDETVKAVLYTPQGKGPFPALVVIHEYWGLTPWVKEQAAKLADQGYVALAIDLYRGKWTTSPDEAHELMRGVPEDRANSDLKAAFNYLASQKNVAAKRIGAIGWCMGGGYALDLALSEPRLAASVINYGHLASERSTLEKIQAPILGSFGGQDRGIPADSVRKFEQQMKALGKSVEIKIYPDAGHAFENPNNKAGYREADAKDAWDRTITFLAAKLKNR
ncbi:MAG: dienelactone hydrolase family protein [Candidatus Korobacteraceae bacterium]|jgi:carboxymethylenebutenolidase